MIANKKFGKNKCTGQVNQRRPSKLLVHYWLQARDSEDARTELSNFVDWLEINVFSMTKSLLAKFHIYIESKKLQL